MSKTVTLISTAIFDSLAKEGPYTTMVYVALVRFCEDKNAVKISRQQIADVTGMSRHKTATSIDRLIELGLISKTNDNGFALNL